MDAITLLKTDHRTVEALFARFEKLGDGKDSQKRKLVEQITKELSIHSVIEETLFYPAARKLVPDAEDDVLEALEEHHVMKWTLSELERMSPDNERYDAKVTVLIESVRHHIKEEEKDFFPKVRKGMSRTQLADLGEAMAKAKRIAPTRPHPRAPDEPPGNLLAGMPASVIDRVRDASRRVIDRMGNGNGGRNGHANGNGTNGHNGHGAHAKRKASGGRRTTAKTHGKTRARSATHHA